MGALRGIPPLEGVGRNEVRPQGETSPSLYFKRSFSVTLVVYTLRILLEGADIEDVIRTAVSLGGDCDTLTDIATGMGEVFFGLPEQFKKWAYEFTTDDMHEVMKAFEEKAIARKLC